MNRDRRTITFIRIEKSVFMSFHDYTTLSVFVRAIFISIADHKARSISEH